MLEGKMSDTIYRLSLVYTNESFLATYDGDELKHGDWVIAQNRYGKDLAQVLGVVRCPEARLAEPVAIERLAGENDLKKRDENKKLEAGAFDIAREKIAERGLEMKLISVHYLLEEPKIIFFFFAENRVDFRMLVKDLVASFKARIELRQIGVRDEARILGGMGICGRDFCCHGVSDKLKPVSIKMAKDQNLSLNAVKISGPCDRLLCCLAYEHPFYHEQKRTMPMEGGRITYEGEEWKVTEANVVSGMVTLSAGDNRQMQLPQARFQKTDNKWVILEEEPL
jgi:cell fate regulator YaaT (PSP1 superfamily)